MDIRKVKKLIELLEESAITEIEIKEGEESVRITRGGATVAPIAMGMPTMQAAPAGLAPIAPLGAAPSSAPQFDGEAIRSPMVGTFYRAASPEAEPFVKVGTKVKTGDSLCIIEAMKILNSIDAETCGTVTEVLIEDGEPVEYDQPMFVIAP